jgi:hypothetical protein
MNGSPRYERVEGTNLIGYMDDNEDGVTDGSDGGIYAGWSIVGSSSVQGMGGLAANQHDYQDAVSMPNLTDFTYYEERAKNEAARLRIDGVLDCTGVYGDDPGENRHLYLHGTAANPIVIDGPVVVRGSLIISGVVTGQGSLYVAGNIYVADDITYKNPLTTDRPASNDEATTEQWLQDNQNADSLGLYAREHVVLGDYTDSNWQSSVSSWVNNATNESKEDAGLDGIPNTRAGRDGVSGTADDDVLEGDGVFSIETYSQLHADLGLIPPELVGQPIPGTGEDIDGDGQYDPRTSMSEFDLPSPLNSGLWGGNLAPGTTNYNEVATNQIARVDGALYTNHTLAGRIENSGAEIRFNGCVISRNEAIVFNASQLIFNHDARLLGGGKAFGFHVPLTWAPIKVLIREVR